MPDWRNANLTSSECFDSRELVLVSVKLEQVRHDLVKHERIDACAADVQEI